METSPEVKRRSIREGRFRGDDPKSHRERTREKDQIQRPKSRAKSRSPDSRDQIQGQFLRPVRVLRMANPGSQSGTMPSRALKVSISLFRSAYKPLYDMRFIVNVSVRRFRCVWREVPCACVQVVCTYVLLARTHTQHTSLCIQLFDPVPGCVCV